MNVSKRLTFPAARGTPIFSYMQIFHDSACLNVEEEKKEEIVY